MVIFYKNTSVVNISLGNKARRQKTKEKNRNTEMQTPYPLSAILITTVTVLLVHSPCPCTADGYYENATDLMTHLLGSKSGYNPDVRPRDNQSHPIIVNVIFSLVSIVEVDDVKQQFTMNGFLGMSWEDERVGWDPRVFGGISYISPQPKHLWRPRVLLLNTLEQRDLFKDDHSPLFVYDDSTVYWMPGGLFKASCGLNMNKYPFDTQKCFMVFTPMTAFINELQFNATDAGFKLEFFVANEGWELTSTSVYTIEITTGPSDRFSSIRLDFTLKRRPSFFVLNIILPVCVLSFLNNFVFVIPDESGEKIGYGITVLLSLSVFLTTVSGMVPRSSNNIPAVTVYLFILLMASVLSILVGMFVVWLHHREEAEETHVKAQVNYKQAVNKVFRMQRALSKVGTEESVRRRSSPEVKPGEEFGIDETKDESPKSNKYKLISRHINKVCFFGSTLLWVIINLAFFIYTNS